VVGGETQAQQAARLRVAWQSLRKVLEARAARHLRHAEVTPPQVGSLYALRALVGEVWYNILHGDSRRHEPLEPHILPGFQRLSDQVLAVIESGVLQATEPNPLSVLGEAVFCLDVTHQPLAMPEMHVGRC